MAGSNPVPQSIALKLSGIHKLRRRVQCTLRQTGGVCDHMLQCAVNTTWPDLQPRATGQRFQALQSPAG